MEGLAVGGDDFRGGADVERQGLVFCDQILREISGVDVLPGTAPAYDDRLVLRRIDQRHRYISVVEGGHGHTRPEADAAYNVGVRVNHEVVDALDIAIASLHTPCYHGERTKEAVLGAYRNVMLRENIDIIGHPDDGRFPVDYEELVKLAVETGTLLEVNNASLTPGGFRKDTRGNDIAMLKECKKQGAMVVLGSDAHVDVSLADYRYVEEVLEAADFPEELVANTTLEKLVGSLKRNQKGVSKKV